MAGNFLESLKAEIASIEAEIERDERLVRLRELKKVLDLYPRAMVPVLDAARPPAQKAQSGRRGSPERAKALRAARLFVANMSGPVPTREVLAHLKSQNISIAGANQINSLSAMLSTSEQFKAHGRKGWTLRATAELDPAATPTLAPAGGAIGG